MSPSAAELAPGAAERPLFGLERMWVVADRVWPSFQNQLVIEGEGSPDPEALRRAVEAVLPAWPGARSRLVGALRAARWRADGALPAVGGDVRLDPVRGPVVALDLAPGRVVVRAHHGVFDGRAAWAWVRDLGAVLRHAPVVGAHFAGVRDPGVASATPEPPADVALPVDAPADAAASPVWARRTLHTSGRGLVARVAAALAASRGDRLRISVPVDLRDGPDAVCANLAGVARLDVAPDDTPAAVDAQLHAALAGDGPRGTLGSAEGLRGVPLWLLAWAGRREAEAGLARGRVRVSATLSNLGRQDASVLDHPGFVGRRLYWIPPVNPGSPAFLTLTGHAEGIELVVGLAAGLGDHGRAERLADELAARVSG